MTVLEAGTSSMRATATSRGGIWISANPWSAAHGVEDSVEGAIRYLRAMQAAGGGRDELIDAYS